MVGGGLSNDLFFLGSWLGYMYAAEEGDKRDKWWGAQVHRHSAPTLNVFVMD